MKNETNKILVAEVTKNLNARKDRSAWDKGVTVYCFELLENLINHHLEFEISKLSLGELEKIILNGAENWFDYSWGGCSFIYNEDICKNLCPPSIQRKLKFGQFRPNKYENWLDVQARALRQAKTRLFRIVLNVLNNTVSYDGYAEVVANSDAEPVSKGA